MGSPPKPTKRHTLVAARKAAGYTQETLAARIGVERSTIFRWESGETLPLPWLRPGLAQLLGLDNEQLAVLLGEPSDEDSTEERQPENNSDSVPECTIPPITPMPVHTPSSDLTTILLSWSEVTSRLLLAITSGVTTSGNEANKKLADLDRLVDMMQRRGLIQLFGQLTAGSTLASPVFGGLQLLGNLVDPDEHERVTETIVSPERVDERVIGHIETMLWACQRQEDTFGPQSVLNTILDQQRLVHDVLLPACPDSLLPRMLALYSRLCGSAGWYFFDLNSFELARHQFEQARKSAHEAQHTELSVYTLCNLSGTASWHGQKHVGFDLATAAQTLVAKTDDPLLRACVADKAAQAYAINRQYGECMKELDKAQGLLSTSAGQTPPESLAYYYSEGLIANHRSLAMLRLGKHQEAVASARAGVTLYDRSFARDFAFCTLRLGNALAQSKEVDEAASTIGEAAELIAQIGSTRLVNELHTVRAAMQPWQDTRPVSELDEQLTDLGLNSSV